MKRLRCLFAAVLLGVAAAGGAASAQSVSVPVTGRAFSLFAVGSEARVFGKLEFLGGFTFSSSDALLGAISAIRFREDREHFVAVLDTGHWLTGKIQRDEEGRLSGLDGLAITSMLNAEGRNENEKYRMDAEGLALGHGELLVSYEQRHRIDLYPDPGFETSAPLRTLPLPFPVSELRRNQGLETVAMSPPGSPLGYVPVTVAERSLDADGHLIAAVLEGPRKGTFAIRRNDPWDVTDGAFLPNGDLLLLERRFRLSDGVGMRIRRIAGSDIKPGAVVDGEVLLDADMSHQIDNMEAMDVVSMPDGDVRIFVVSDDNHSILQRNLMLEFRLLQTN
ncbi:MAG: esterase-like activity of phytase family protein [Shinella sp.]|nr:esterase-like activity of phytase family protein [Shinella sp.]